MSWEVRTMQSKTSYFNATLFRKNLTRFWPLWGLASFIGALFPLAVLLDMVHNGMFVIQCYGATETCAAGIINFAQDEKHIGAVGQGSEYMDYKLSLIHI